MNPILSRKLKQAHEALQEAEGLLADGAELCFVVNSLYYAFLYTVHGLLQARGMSAPMQSIALELFDREFVQTGIVDGRYMIAIRRAFELRPSCSCESPKHVTRPDIEHLLPIATEFLHLVEEIPV